MVRKAVVAGQFYSGRRSQLEKEVTSLMKCPLGKYSAVGIVAPHAGYMYSGGVAGNVYASIKNLKESVVIIGPNHTGLGEQFSLMSTENWMTPLGEVAVDDELAKMILKTSQLIKEDKVAHTEEHSIEVQLPFLQKLKPNVKIVPITVSFADIDTLTAVAGDIVRAIKKIKIKPLIIASSDMTHYEDQESAKSKDLKAIDSILNMDEAGLVRRVKEYNISMCGCAPAAIMLIISKELGAGTAKLIKYQTSGDISGDYSSVVGYAGIIVT